MAALARERLFWGRSDYDEDDYDDGNAACVSEANLVCRFRARADILSVDRDRVLGWLEAGSLLTAVLVGLWISSVKVGLIPVGPDFIGEVRRELLDSERSDGEVTMRRSFVDRARPTPTEVRRPMRRPSGHGTTRGARGRPSAGNPLARSTGSALTALLSSSITGLSTHSGDPAGLGGTARHIDEMLSGKRGLSRMGDAGEGRRSFTGIGFRNGQKNGTGSGGIDGLIAGPGGADRIDLQPRGLVDPTSPGPEMTDTGPISGAFMGGRSRQSILRVVMQNMNALRYAYNRRLLQVPGLNGKIVVRFAIDEMGKVVFCDIVEASLSDEKLQKEIVSQIRNWRFDRIDKVGDITEVRYPFVFSM